MKPLFFVTVILAMTFGISLAFQVIGVRDNADRNLGWATGRGLDEMLFVLPFAVVLSMVGIVQYYLKKKESDLLLSYVVGCLGWVSAGLWVFIWG